MLKRVSLLALLTVTLTAQDAGPSLYGDQFAFTVVYPTNTIRVCVIYQDVDITPMEVFAKCHVVDVTSTTLREDWGGVGCAMEGYGEPVDVTDQTAICQAGHNWVIRADVYAAGGSPSEAVPSNVMQLSH